MTFESQANIGRTVLLAGVLGIGTAALSGPVAAETSGDGQSGPSVETPAATLQLQKKQKEIRRVASELRRIQKKATDADPGLEARRDDYRDLVLETMTSEDFDAEAEIERMRKLQAELQGRGELDQTERQAKAQKLRRKQQQFRSKQRQAMQVEDVRAARRQLNKEMKAAMEKQNPEVEAMIARLNQLQREYRSLLQEAMQRQDGTASPEG